MPLICQVPACENPREVEDCCHAHSLNQSRQGEHLPNDGVLDWFAIDLVARGVRPARLTWVETDIAAAMMVVLGARTREVRDRLHVRLEGRRRQAIFAMADALKAAGYGI